MNNPRYSLITPTISRVAPQKSENAQSSKKRKRETFEIQTYKILPDLTPTIENKDKSYVPPITSTMEQEQIVIKTEKGLEIRSESLKDTIKMKSDKMLKFKSITQSVDSYVELDEKLIDLNNIKDYSMDNEYELCFDEFIKAKSIPLPERIRQVYEEAQAQSSENLKCITQIFPEANLVVFAINHYLFLWQYYVNNNIDDYDASYELESRYNEKWRFFEYEMKAPIRAVGLGKPIARIFPSQDVAHVLAVATSFNVQLYTISFAHNEISMKYTDLETNFDDELSINKIIFSKNGKIYAAQSNEEVVVLNYESGKTFQRLIPFLVKNPLSLEPSKKKNFLMDISKTLTTLFIQPFQKNYFYSMVDLALDDTRHILYAYGVKINNEYDFIIQIYDLGVTGEDFKLLTVLKTVDVKREIRMRCKLEESELNKLKIASMIPLEKNVSETLQLLLVTNLGIRLYYQFNNTTHYTGLGMTQNTETSLASQQNIDIANLADNYNILTEPIRPTERISVRLVKSPIVQPIESLQGQINQYPIHQRVKLGSANIINAQNKRISWASNYKRNLFIVLGDDQEPKYASNSNPQQRGYPNQMYSITVNNAFQARAKNAYSSQRIIPECVSLCNISNNIYINSLAPKEDQYLLTKPLARLLGYDLPQHILRQKFIGASKAGTVSMDCLSELVRQVYYPPHTTLMLDDSELHYLVKFRPVDLLYQILVTNDENEFSQFCERYGRGETCAMLLQLICNAGAKYYFNTETGPTYAEDAQKKNETSQFQDRMQSKIHSQSDERNFRIIDLSPELKQKAMDLFLSIGNSLSHSEFTDHTWKQGELSLGKFIEPQKKKYTSKLEGLFIYFSRVVRPIWSNFLMNYYVFEGFVPGQISFYKQEDLLILKNRLEEMREFLQYRGSVLLTKGGEQDQKSRQSSSFIDLKSNLSYTSTTASLPQVSKDVFSNQARMNEELQNVLFEDQKTIDNFNEFLEKAIQALDIFMCLINDPLDLRKCIYELGQADSQKFVKLRFHDILRDGEYESLFRSLLYIKLLRINENQFMSLAQQFKSRFWMFFSNSDAYICQAERNLEMAYLSRDDNERNRLVSYAVDILKGNSEYIPKERLGKLLDLFIALNLAPEFVRILIERVKTLAVLQAKLRNASYNSSDELTKLTLTEIASEINLCREYVLNIFQEVQFAIHQRDGTSIFANLNNEALFHLKKRIIQEIQTFDEEFLHTSLIKFLIRNGNVDDILNLDSKYVEGVLASSNELEQKDFLLLDFFKKTEQYEKAFNAALTIAMKDQTAILNNGQYVIPNPKVIIIQQRVSYIRSALQCLQKAIEATIDLDKRNSLVKQRAYVTSLIDRTEIQQKATERYEALFAHAKQVDDQEKAIFYDNKIGELHRQIVDPVYLYENYIQKDGLHECKLMVLNLEPEPLPEEIDITYDLLIHEIYDEDTKSWPKSIRSKLLDLFALFTQKRNVMFPLRKVLLTIEEINSNHEPFFDTLQQLMNSLMGAPQQKKNQVKFVPTDMQYWATYFFTDKLEFSFKQVLNAYREIYELQALEEDSHFIQFHVCNCMLVLIEWWLIKAQNQSREVSNLSLHSKRLDQSSTLSEVYSIRDEIFDILNKLEVDLRLWKDSKLFDPKLIEMSSRLAVLVRGRYDEVLRNIGDQSNIFRSTNESGFRKDSKRSFSIDDNLRSYSKRSTL